MTPSLLGETTECRTSRCLNSSECWLLFTATIETISWCSWKICGHSRQSALDWGEAICNLHGWGYKIEPGEGFAYDVEAGQFVVLAECRSQIESSIRQRTTDIT
jgi:hypothetical protein